MSKIDEQFAEPERFSIEELDDRTSSPTTAALVNGQQVDVSAVLRWDEQRQKGDVLEATLGGAAVPVGSDRKKPAE